MELSNGSEVIVRRYQEQDAEAIANLIRGEYTKEEKIFRKKTDTFSGVYWCLATAIYLAWSLWTMSWDITWIVWPVAGVLFAALLSVVKMVLKKF